MKLRYTLASGLLIIAACSETPVEEQGEAAIAEQEKQIEEDAQSLEDAADEAVKVLAEDIDAELAADGFGDPAVEQMADETEN